MFTQLRMRLLVSSLVTVALVAGLVIFIVVERLNLSSDTNALIQVERATRQARELSLYVQYNAHDTNAYTLGHMEHRQEFDLHSAAFIQLLRSLQQQVTTSVLDEDTQADLDAILQLRTQYDQAAQELFAAADVNRTNPSPANQAQEDSSWQRTDELGDQLNSASQLLADNLRIDVEAMQEHLSKQNPRMISAVLGLGVGIIVLIVLIQQIAAAAVGQPLKVLLNGVQQLAAGNFDAQVDNTRGDEIGALARAFNTMASALRQRTEDLQAQYAAATQSKTVAEAARAELATQLAMVEAQREVIREMSVPVLPLSASTLVMPLVGALDPERLSQIEDRALHAIERAGARHLVLDVTGVAVIDTLVAHGLLKIVQAARLLGAEVIIVGIRPEVAQAIVGLGVYLGDVVTRSTLQNGIAYASGVEGLAALPLRGEGYQKP